MAIPIGDNLSELWPILRAELDSARNILIAARNRMQGGAVDIDDITSLGRKLSRLLKTTLRAQGLTGLQTFIRNQVGDPVLAVDTILEGLRASTVTALNRIATDIPTNAGGFLLEKKIVQDGDGAFSFEANTASSAQTAALVTDVNAVLASL